MRAFVITGPRQTAVEDVARPAAAPGQAVIDVELAGVCGTDVEFFTGEMAYLHQGHAKYPVRPGHEWCGTVAAVGEGVDPAWVAHTRWPARSSSTRQGRWIHGPWSRPLLVSAMWAACSRERARPGRAPARRSSSTRAAEQPARSWSAEVAALANGPDIIRNPEYDHEELQQNSVNCDDYQEEQRS